MKPAACRNSRLGGKRRASQQATAADRNRAIQAFCATAAMRRWAGEKHGLGNQSDS
jgi:hypothetical protein